MGARNIVIHPVFLFLVGAILAGGCSDKEEDWRRMKTASVAEVGRPAPDFVLTDLNGVEHRLSDYISKGRTVILEWFNPDCPHVKKHHVDFPTISELYEAMLEQKVVIFAINSAAPGMQGYGLERNKQAKIEFGMKYPILLDETGDVGRMYRAKTTPQIFIIGMDGILIYLGAVDEEPALERIGSIKYARVALEQYLSGRVVSVKKTRPYGCNVKYGPRTGN
ncbi:MAG: redoxin domain-containing protein [Candidatus Eisenbacteria bacterium]